MELRKTVRDRLAKSSTEAARDTTATDAALESLDVRDDVVDALLTDRQTMRRRYVAVRAWPGADLGTINELAAAAAAADSLEVVVFTCPASPEVYDETLAFANDGAWKDENSEAKVVRSAELFAAPFSGLYRSCVVQFFVEGASDAELERIVDRFAIVSIPVELRSFGNGCTAAREPVPFSIDHEWEARSGGIQCKPRP